MELLFDVLRLQKCSRRWLWRYSDNKTVCNCIFLDKRVR